MKRILYLTYDGLTDALGQSQIIPYLTRLANEGNQISIISFEKEDLFKKHGSSIRQIVSLSKLDWHPLNYTKRPPVASTIYDIWKGYQLAKILHGKHDFQIVHCRGYISSLIGRKLKTAFGLSMIFDMRGWWPDEKMESGYWASPVYKPVYKYFKNKERLFFTESDKVVSLTYKGKEAIVNGFFADPDRVGVIPTCVDFEIFKPRNETDRALQRKSLGIHENESVFVYSGSIGGNYEESTLIDVFLEYSKHHPNSYLLILSKDPVGGAVIEKLKSAGIKRFSIHNAAFREVSRFLCASDVGFIYYKLEFSTIGRSPTKMGEYWASGIPVISFKGIGDLDSIISKYPDSGILLSAEKSNWGKEMQQLSFAHPEKLRQYSIDYFHIQKGVQFYNSIYNELS